MSDEYYDDLAEQYESSGSSASGGGGGAKKYKKKPTTAGKMRLGGAQAWGTTEKKCAKGCLKKCCAPTPSLIAITY